MMSERLADIVKQMVNSGQTEQIAVAECLLDIAQDGDGDEFLLVCAEEIRDAAQGVLDTMADSKK
jgi:hypothetical protein